MKFETIEGSQSYTKLKTLPPFVKSQDVLFNSIFTHVKEEMDNVSKDMKYVHKIIQSDIKNESEQMTKLDEKLRNSAKRINHIFLKNQRFREKYGNNSYGSKKFQVLKDNVDTLEEKIESIKSIGDQILNHFIETDCKLRENHRLLRPDIINERHYPTIFALLKEKHPGLFGRSEPKDENLESFKSLPEADTRPGSPVDNVESEHNSLVKEEQSSKVINTDTNNMILGQDLIGNENENEIVDNNRMLNNENTNSKETSDDENNKIEHHNQEENESKELTIRNPENDENDDDETGNDKNALNENSKDLLCKVSSIENLEEDGHLHNDKMGDTSGTNLGENLIKGAMNDNNESNAELGVDTPLYPTEPNNDESNENESIISSVTSSKESETSVLKTAEMNKIKTSLANPFTLRSFKKPSKAQTLTTMKNISASDITSSNISVENLVESLGKI